MYEKRNHSLNSAWVHWRQMPRISQVQVQVYVDYSGSLDKNFEMLTNFVEKRESSQTEKFSAMQITNIPFGDYARESL